MEDVQPMWEIIKHLTEAPDSQLDKSMCDKLKEILDEFEGKEDCSKEVADKLLYVLDMCVHSALASSLVIMVIDGEWKRLGGTIEPDNANCPWRNR